jgi:general L-amino acid transport system substrate-binding protein
MLKRLMAAAFVAACTLGSAQAGPTLDAIRARGQLSCGINTGVAGLALPDSRGEWQGLEVELCRGLAAAILNDAAKVRFVPLTASTRFTTLTSGEIDVLFRGSTQTMLRDTTLGLRHVVTYFYDGHGFLLRRDANVTRARDLGRLDDLRHPGHHQRAGDGGLFPLRQRALPTGGVRAA